MLLAQRLLGTSLPVATILWEVAQIPLEQRHPLPSSTKHVDWAGMKGECERAQIWLRSESAELTNVVVTNDLASPNFYTSDVDVVGPNGAWRDIVAGRHQGPFDFQWWQVGYINCSKPLVGRDGVGAEGYRCLAPNGTVVDCRAGWYPDVLLEPARLRGHRETRGLPSPFAHQPMLLLAQTSTATGPNLSTTRRCP